VLIKLKNFKTIIIVNPKKKSTKHKGELLMKVEKIKKRKKEIYVWMRLLEIGASSRGGGGVGNCGAKNRMTQQRASQQVSRQKNKRGF
jgi:hypothetical protein